MEEARRKRRPQTGRKTRTASEGPEKLTSSGRSQCILEPLLTGEWAEEGCEKRGRREEEMSMRGDDAGGESVQVEKSRRDSNGATTQKQKDRAVIQG